MPLKLQYKIFPNSALSCHLLLGQQTAALECLKKCCVLQQKWHENRKTLLRCVWTQRPQHLKHSDKCAVHKHTLQAESEWSRDASVTVLEMMICWTLPDAVICCALLLPTWDTPTHFLLSFDLDKSSTQRDDKQAGWSLCGWVCACDN